MKGILTNHETSVLEIAIYGLSFEWLSLYTWVQKKTETMKKIFTLVLTLIVLLKFDYSNAQNVVSIDSFRQELQSILDDYTVNQGMDGAALSIIIGDSVPTENFYSGLRAPGIPVDTLKPWHFASVSGNQITYIVLKLIEEGSLSLDDSIGMHMDAAAMGLDGSIRILELLRHTSPMTEFWVNSPPSACFMDIWVNNPTVLACPEDILSCRPADIPSKRGTHDFNNMNMITLGYLIDSVTGNSYKTEFQNRVFTPFGMDGTYLSGCDPITIDSINGIWTTNLGYANNQSYIRYFSTNGPNRGLISKPEHVVAFTRAYFQDKLLAAPIMDSVRKEIPGSSQPQGSYNCASNIVGKRGYNTDILEIVKNSGDTLIFYGKAGLGMNASLSYHWPEKDWTISFVNNDRSRQLELRNIGIDLICYLDNIDSIVTSEPNGLENTDAFVAKVYPNPVVDIVNLDINAIGHIELSLTDIYGRLLDQIDISDAHIGTIEYAIPSNIKNGSYFITVKSESGSSVHRIQVQH